MCFQVVCLNFGECLYSCLLFDPKNFRYMSITEDTRIDVKMNHKEEEVLVCRTMDSVDKWTEATCYVGRRSDLFSLFVEAHPNVVGDLIALDDFSLADCTFPRPAPDGCGEDHFTCDNGKSR